MSGTESDSPKLDRIRLSLVFLLLATAGWISIALPLQPHPPVAVIWLPNAMLLAVLLNTPRRQWAVYLLCGGLANLLAHQLGHRGLLMTTGFVLNDSLEIMVAAYGLRRFCGEKLELIESRQLMRFVLICVVVAPALFAVCGSGWLLILGRSASLDQMKMRYAGHALAMAMVVPAAWAMVPGRLRELFTGPMARRSLELFALLATVTIYVFTAHSYPVPFLIFAILLLIAFQLGLVGALVGAVMVSSAAMIATLSGHGPFMLVASESFAHRIQLLQIYMAAIMFTTLLVGLQVEESRHKESQLRASEQLLREQYEELVQYYAAMPVGLALLDRDLRYIRVNDRFANFFERSAGECAGKRLSDLAPEVALRAAPNYQRALTTGEPVLNVEIQGAPRSQPDQPRLFLANYYPLKSADGQVQKLCVAVLDITERKRNEEELRRAHERLELAQEAAGYCVWEWDVQTGQIEWSPRLSALLGLDPDMVVPSFETWLAALHPEDRQYLLTQIGDGPKNPGPFEVEYRIIRPDQEVRWIRTVGRTIGEGERPTRINGICLDITKQRLSDERLRDFIEQRHQAEEQLRRTNERLKMAEEQLRDFSHQLLSVREEEKRRLSGVLHHDVGSIAVSVSARLNAAEEDLELGNRTAAMASLRECGRLFGDSVSRLKTLAVDLRPPDLDLLGLGAALRQHVQQVAKDTGLRINFTDKSAGHALSSEAQTVLFRIAQECLNNIVKHAQASQARIRLAPYRGQLRLSVLDNGAGFDRDALPKVAYTHLGVRAMQEMAQTLGSTLVITSHPGNGTRVSLIIPLQNKIFTPLES